VHLLVKCQLSKSELFFGKVKTKASLTLFENHWHFHMADDSHTGWESVSNADELSINQNNTPEFNSIISVSVDAPIVSSSDRYSKFKASSEKDHWRDANPIWRKFEVAKPRTETLQDSTTPWDVKYYPETMSKFLGQTNKEAKHQLSQLIINNEMRNIIVHGQVSDEQSNL